jgi:hypothetical protein
MNNRGKTKMKLLKLFSCLMAVLFGLSFASPVFAQNHDSHSSDETMEGSDQAAPAQQQVKKSAGKKVGGSKSAKKSSKKKKQHRG